MRWLAIAVIPVGLAAAVWSGWHYRQYESCGERSCSPASDDPTIRLESGEEIPVLSTREDERRRLVLEYVTRRDRDDLASLCEEARAVWRAVGQTIDTRRMERATLGPTNPESEFLGMKYLVVPLYTCCVSTYLRVEKDRTGAWVFPECPS
jgi:hypothetical protein